MWLVYMVIVLSLCQSGVNQTDTNNYGPYQLIYQKIEACKGPKHADCGKFYIQNIQNPSDIIFYLDFVKDCHITGAKVTISTLQTNKTSTKLWNYPINKPCQHFVLGPILMEKLNVTTNCKITKGQYYVHLNLEEQSKKFLGSSFFYGTYIFKTAAYNKNCNIFCVLTELAVKRT